MNPRHQVLETCALPTELHSYQKFPNSRCAFLRNTIHIIRFFQGSVEQRVRPLFHVVSFSGIDCCMDKRVSQPSLMIVIGLPGAGKTTFAASLSSHLGMAHIHDDRISNELGGSENVDKLADYITEEILKTGGSVILDIDASRLARRRKLRNLAQKHKAHAIVVWIQTDTDTAMKRLLKNKAVSKPDFIAAAKHLQKPSQEDSVVISGKHPFKSQLAVIERKLMAIGLLGASGKKAAQDAAPQAKLGGRVDFKRRQISIR